MKKMRLFCMLIVSAIAMVACTKDDTPPNGSPITVTLSPTTATANPGDSVAINCSITDDNTLKDVVITETLAGGSPSQLESYSLTGKSYQFTYEYHVPTGVTGAITVTFTVDDASNTQTATTTVTVGVASKDYNSYNAVLLGSYADPNAGSFYGSSNNTVYTKSTANLNQGLVDMVFFYGSTNQYTLAAPSDPSFGTGTGQISSLGIQDWTTMNATSFKTTTLTDFSTITKGSDIEDAYNAGSNADTKANMLVAGDVIAFKTASGKYGLCMIVDASGGDTSGNGEMHIQVVIQQ